MSAVTFQGMPCRRGHSLRYVSGNCVECTKGRANRMRLLPKVAAAKAAALVAAKIALRSKPIERAYSKSERAWLRLAATRGVRAAIATKIGVHHQTVEKWTRVPLEHVFTVSSMYRVLPEDLRPDFFRNDPLRRASFVKVS